MTDIPLQGSYNARGIGHPEAPWLVRSASPDTLTVSDEQRLRALGVDRIIDLREPSEQRAASHLMEIVSIPLYGEQPPQLGTLEDIYLGLVRDRGEALTRAVIAIAEHSGTCLVHCAAGKDRTGIVVALARSAAGDPREAIIADYAESGRSVRPARGPEVFEQLDSLGITGGERAAAERLHLDSPARAIATALDVIDTLGGAQNYLLAHGARSSHIEALRALARGNSVPAQHPAPVAVAEPAPAAAPAAAQTGALR